MGIIYPIVAIGAMIIGVGAYLYYNNYQEKLNETRRLNKEAKKKENENTKKEVDGLIYAAHESLIGEKSLSKKSGLSVWNECKLWIKDKVENAILSLISFFKTKGINYIFRKIFENAGFSNNEKIKMEKRLKEISNQSENKNV